MGKPCFETLRMMKACAYTAAVGSPVHDRDIDFVVEHPPHLGRVVYQLVHDYCHKITEHYLCYGPQPDKCRTYRGPGYREF